MLIELGSLILANIIAFAVVWIAVSASSVPMRVRAAFAVTVISLSLWQDIAYISNNAQTYQVFWDNFVFVWPTLGVFSFFAFLYGLNPRHRKGRRVSTRAITGIFIAAISLGTAMQIASIATWQLFIAGPAGTIERGDIYPMYLVGLVLSFIAVIGYLVASLIQARRGTLAQYRALRIVLVTTIVAMICGVITQVILPLTTGGQEYAGLGVIAILTFSIGLALSIIRHGLIDVKRAIVRSAAYALVLLTLAGIYYVLAYAVSLLLFRGNVSEGLGQGMSLSPVNVLLALLLAFAFQPLKRFFDKVTDKIFYRDQYSPEVFYGQLNRTIVSTTKLYELLRRSSALIAETFKAEHVSFALKTDKGRYVRVGVEKYSRMPASDLAVIDESITDITLADRLPEGSAIHRLLVSHRISIVVPIENEQAIGGLVRIGYLFLGDNKRSGYTARDVKTLRSVGNEFIIAIQNALSLQEVRDLNESLEQRIDEATRELRASNAQLHRLDEAKDEFISMASHQLRTPLTSVKGYISMLMEGDVGELNSRQKQLLSEAFMGSERMVRLIGDFLNVSRMQTGKFMIERHTVDLAKLVQEELDGLKPNAATRKVKFIYKRPKNVPLMELDENKIQQVVMNFADNAVFYSKDNGTVTVDLKKVGKMIEFTVKDNGIGVPLEEQKQLFHKFFRATNARKQRPDGTGVGIFLAKRVIDGHGGEIIFSSVEGKGSTFGFRLPLPSSKPKSKS